MHLDGHGWKSITLCELGGGGLGLAGESVVRHPVLAVVVAMNLSCAHVMLLVKTTVES